MTPTSCPRRRDASTTGSMPCDPPRAPAVRWSGGDPGGVESGNLEGADRPGEARQRQVADESAHDEILGRRVHALGDEDLPGRRFVAKARGQVGNAPDGGVIEAAGKADPAERGVALGDAHPESQLIPPPLPAVGQFLHPLAHLQRHPDGPQGRVVTRDGIVEKDHEPIAREPLQGPLEAGYEVADGTVILPESLPDILGFSRFGEGDEATQVAAHYRDLAAVPVEERIIA